MNTYNNLSQSISRKVLVPPALPQISLRWISVAAAVLVVSLLIFYVFQINQLTRASFYISSYEQKIVNLLEENKYLEANFSQANSLASLELLLRNYNYVEVNKVHYIQILEGTMAAK